MQIGEEDLAAAQAAVFLRLRLLDLEDQLGALPELVDVVDQLGAGVAVFLRIIFTGIVVTLMGLPFLKLVGGLALLVIAAKLLVPEQEDEGGVDAASHAARARRADS